MIKTTDNKNYYSRIGQSKSKAIFDYIENLDWVETVFDVGCNNGNISYPLQKKLGKKVYGIDLSNDLSIPEDYNFEEKDIVADTSVYMNDVTLFLSLYHHIMGAFGIEVADDVFLKLLLRSERLIFDTGNLSEKRRKNTYWYKEQQKHFNTEQDLLEHLPPHDVLGKWNCGGGSREICVFIKRYDFDLFVNVVEEYRRLDGTKHISKGLVPLSETGERKDVFPYAKFYKLKWNDKFLYAKKILPEHPIGEAKELQNIIDSYNVLPGENLIRFYGVSDRYGLIFEWLDDFKFIRSNKKVKLSDGSTLTDVEKIQVGEEVKFIDFER